MRKGYISRMLAAAVFLLAAVPAYAKDTSFPNGIYVGDLNLGGMTQEEATEKLNAIVDEQANREIRLTVNGTQIQATARELGLAWSNTDALQEAVSHTSKGNLIEQYMERKDLEKDPVHIDLKTSVNPSNIEALIRKTYSDLIQEPKNATIALVNGTFEIVPEVSGITINAQETAVKVNDALAESDSDLVLADAVLIEKVPEVREEMLATIGDVLGTFSTDFSSSSSSRAGNLQNGALKINGRVLMPGQTLSGYECMHPFTTENGYFTAAAYENGEVVDSVGGGVCQIATTLYNASLLAELEIAQRQNHSMVVGYVQPSMDAAIAGTYKDIKITNNYSTPIYIEGGTRGTTLFFTIYGKETRPANRKIEYVSETLQTIDPGTPTRREDRSLAPGTTRQVQSAHIGQKSRLWKVVTVNGVETERTLLHEDTYNPAKAIILVGPERTQEETSVSSVQTPSSIEETQAVSPPQEEETTQETEPSSQSPEQTNSTKRPSASLEGPASSRQTQEEETKRSPQPSEETSRAKRPPAALEGPSSSRQPETETSGRQQEEQQSEENHETQRDSDHAEGTSSQAEEESQEETTSQTQEED